MRRLDLFSKRIRLKKVPCSNKKKQAFSFGERERERESAKQSKTRFKANST